MKSRAVLIIAFLVGVITVIASCQSEDELNFKRYYSAGSVLYQAHCQNCHGANGEGLGALIPALNDSVYLKTMSHQLPCLVKNGIQDSITVKGNVFTGQMPAQAELTAIEIAQVLTYTGNTFGNKLGLVDVVEVDGDLKRCN